MRKPKLTYANVMSTVAVFLALGGVSYAAIKLPANSVGTRELRNRSIRTQDLASSTLHSLKGVRGLTGARGVQGVQGSVGPLGPLGPKGDTGSQGLRGETGSTGPKGETGSTGSQGENGSQGLKGDTGSAGPQGEQGLKGDTGLQGETGLQGIKGVKGDTGDAGAKGDTGSAGPQGEQGLKGDTGLQGVKGDTGATGLQGPKGDTGLLGIQGEVGLQGPQGLTGNTGSQGIQGPVGPQGIQGNTGPQGLKGDTGLTGPQGIKGDAGKDGINGTGALRLKYVLQPEAVTTDSYCRTLIYSVYSPDPCPPTSWTGFTTVGDPVVLTIPEGTIHLGIRMRMEQSQSKTPSNCDLIRSRIALVPDEATAAALNVNDADGSVGNGGVSGWDEYWLPPAGTYTFYWKQRVTISAKTSNVSSSAIGCTAGSYTTSNRKAWFEFEVPTE